MKIAASLAGLLAGVLAAEAGAQELVLEPRFRPGDVYTLSLDDHSRTDASSRGGNGRSFEEDVALAYRATVEVLAVDARGRPVRERHDDVQLTFARPDGSGSLFRNGTSYEVRRADGGAPQLFVGERRADREVEEVVVGLLATRFGRGPGPALLDPGRPVGVGDSWELDRGLARRFLRGHGLRVLELGEAPRARLQRRPAETGGTEVVLRYRIPVAWSEVEPMPPNSRTAESEAHYQGEIVLADQPHGRPLEHRASLVLRMNGVVDAPGPNDSFPWRLQRSRRWDQRTRLVSRGVPGGDGLAKASPPPSGPARIAD